MFNQFFIDFINATFHNETPLGKRPMIKLNASIFLDLLIVEKNSIISKI